MRFVQLCTQNYCAQLHDVWEQLRPRDARFTYVCRNAQSRLDRIYVSSGLREHLRTTHTRVCSFTDHKALTLRLCLPQPGSDFWSLRPHLLTGENVAKHSGNFEPGNIETTTRGSSGGFRTLSQKSKHFSFVNRVSSLTNSTTHISVYMLSCGYRTTVDTSTSKC